MKVKWFRNSIILIVFAITLMSFSLSNLNDIKYLIANKLSFYAQNNYPEKVYLQTDKPYYVAGEDLWFSTYLVNGVTHAQSNKSTVVYVDLINNTDSIIATKSIYLKDMSAAADFKLPIDLEEGTYHIRAYTNYMRNQSSDYFFKKEIPVFALSGETEPLEDIGSIDTTTSLKTDTNQFPEIGFYPEGGYLVEGLRNRVALKIENSVLKDGALKGYLEDNTGNRLSEFEFFEFGLSSVQLLPQANKTYQAVLQMNGQEITYPLPKPLPNGYVMNASSHSEEITIELKSTYESGLKGCYLVGHQRGIFIFEKMIEDTSNDISLKIPKQNFVDGVITLTLFNTKNQPVSERILFHRKKKLPIQIEVAIDKEAPAKTEKITTSISISDIEGIAANSRFSVAIRDTKAIPIAPNSETIETWLLLNSDLKGNIKDPGYFFSSGETIKKQYLLDLIMLTHGWRRFSWQELLYENNASTFQPEKGLYIKGNTLDTYSPYRGISAHTKLTFRKNGLYQEKQRTKRNGLYSYGPFIYNDSIDIILEASTSNFYKGEALEEKDVLITMKKRGIPPSILKQNSIRVPYLQPQNYADFIEKSEAIITANYLFDKNRQYLDEVVLKAKAKTQREKEERKRNARTPYTNPNNRVVVDDLGVNGFNSFLELLSNIPGVFVRDALGAISAGSTPQVTVQGSVPSFYLNGRKVPFDLLLSIPPSDIEFIDVLKGSNTLVFALEAKGVIVVYTKQGRERGFSKEQKFPGVLSRKVAGFYTARQFYAPNYEKERNRFNDKDIRNTLHWEPLLKTTENVAETSFSFYTSEISSDYVMDIQGITEDGIPFCKIVPFSVN